MEPGCGTEQRGQGRRRVIICAIATVWSLQRERQFGDVGRKKEKQGYRVQENVVTQLQLKWNRGRERLILLMQ